MFWRFLASLFSVETYTSWRHYSFEFNKRVNEILSIREFDLVHCDILPIYYTIHNRKDVFRSVTDHDVSYLKCYRMARNTPNIFLKSFLYYEGIKLKRMEKNIFRSVDLGIVVSETDKQALVKICPEGNFLVIENGIDVDLFQPFNGTISVGKLLWLGGFSHYPNIEGIKFFLRYVYPLVKRFAPYVSIDIVGDNVTEDLRQFAKMDPHICFTGFVEDPLPYLNSAEIFVAPIMSGGGTKLKVLEAMAAGKAIVTTSIGCEGIEGIPGVHYLVADNEEGFAEAILLLLNNKELRHKIERSAHQLIVSKYNIEDIAEKLSDYYNRI
nr:glycosyltransferase [Desulfatitalea alkaliphila]